MDSAANVIINTILDDFILERSSCTSWYMGSIIFYSTKACERTSLDNGADLRVTGNHKNKVGQGGVMLIGRTMSCCHTEILLPFSEGCFDKKALGCDGLLLEREMMGNTWNP